jgi:protein-L-isoaspartate O-methyltransferase
MVLPVGRTSRDQALLRLTRTADGIVEEHLGDVRFVPLVAGIPGTAGHVISDNAVGDPLIHKQGDVA